MFKGLPVEKANMGEFTQSTEMPMANGKPHYENANYHLWFLEGKWRVSAGEFEPERSACNAHVLPAPNGTVPHPRTPYT